MGDRRFLRPFERVRQAPDRAAAIAALTDEEVVAALAAAGESWEPLLANVLATEAMNRMTRARAVVRHLPDGVLTLDLDGRVTSVNPSAEAHLGWREHELRGRLAREALQAEDAQGRPMGPEECLVEACLRAGRVFRSEGEPIRRKDGAILRVSLAVAPMRRDGELAGIVVTLQPRDVAPAPPARVEMAPA